MKESLIYLDNAATSFPKPKGVLEAVCHVMEDVGGNPGRSGHSMAIAAARVIYESRDLVARLFGVSDSSRIIFTSNATHSLNLAIKGLLKPGDHVVTSSVEHSSVTRPLSKLIKTGVEVSRIACDREGSILISELERTISKKTKLVVLTHASNVIGKIEDVEAVGSICRDRGVTFLLDASQTAGSIPIDVEEMKIDLLAAPGHKGLLGPQGTGILYVGPGINLDTIMEGGTGGGPAMDEQPIELPDRFEAGTMNTPGIAGLGAGVKFILEEGLDKIRAREMALVQSLISGLEAIEGVTIYGPDDINRRASLVSFNIKDLDPAMVSFTLDNEYGIMTRSGLHCAPDAHRALNTLPYGSVRVSPGYFNSPDDIDALIKAIGEIAKKS